MLITKLIAKILNETLGAENNHQIYNKKYLINIFIEDSGILSKIY